MPWAPLELPEKQEQLAAIYAVLEHLPEANHNSLERLIFHLVKQVPAACSPGGRGSPSRAPARHASGLVPRPEPVPGGLGETQALLWRSLSAHPSSRG